MSFIDLLDVAVELQSFCDAQRWQSCFIGGVAVQRWSGARVTRDVDLTLQTGFGGESVFVDKLLAHYAPRRPDAGKFAARNRVLVLSSPGGVGIDISLGALPFEQLVIEHATPFEFAPGVTLRTCSAEDLMVMKLFAGRPIDIRDVEGIAVRHTGTLDWRYIKKQLAPLADAKEDPRIMDDLARVRKLAEEL